ncbi:hypothetical protein ASF72_08725 [Arthrobacter sp. Leaf141]|nr:hypothetical protein ASF72_08725 [Arthrobacter sp. Leaf141]
MVATTWLVEVKSRLPRWAAYVTMPNSIKKAAPISTDVRMEKYPGDGAKKDSITPTNRPNHMPLRAPDSATLG